MVGILDYLLYMKRRALPGEYARLPYIKSTGTQSIATGVTGSLSAEIDIQFIDTETRQLMGYDFSGVDYWGMNLNNQYEMGANNYITGLDATDRHVVYHEATITDGETITLLTVEDQNLVGSAETAPTGQYYLFLINPSDDIYYPCSAKLYGAKIYKDGEKVREFIPCYRKSDNVKGLYDTVNNVFYTNAGTGEFD